MRLRSRRRNARAFIECIYKKNVHDIYIYISYAIGNQDTHMSTLISQRRYATISQIDYFRRWHLKFRRWHLKFACERIAHVTTYMHRRGSYYISCSEFQNSESRRGFDIQRKMWFCALDFCEKFMNFKERDEVRSRFLINAVMHSLYYYHAF